MITNFLDSKNFCVALKLDLRHIFNSKIHVKKIIHTRYRIQFLPVTNESKIKVRPLPVRAHASSPQQIEVLDSSFEMRLLL